MRRVVPRRLNIVLPVALSITNAPELEPAPDIAFLREVLRLEAAEAAALPGSRQRSRAAAANPAITGKRRVIGLFQQRRRARVSVVSPLAGRPVRCDTRSKPWAR